MSTNALNGSLLFSGFVPVRFGTAPKPQQPAMLQSLPADTATFGGGRKLSNRQTLEESIRAAAQLVYGPALGAQVAEKASILVEQIRQARPIHLLKEDYERPADWYKNECVYVMYPERFGVDESGKPNTFEKLIPMLDYLQDLGATTLYILPFLDSPMIDGGFDVKDYRTVRKELGGNKEFDKFLAEAHKRGIKIKADLVLNHISDQHEWFQQALKGDESKLNYFVTRNKPPEYQVMHTEKGMIAVYEEENGIDSARRVIFPDFSDNHYRKETINGQDKYFYHTFYPHQPDVNWKNPAVLYEAIDIMGFWANKGIDIFRLDAIPFLVKTPGTDGENQPETHAVILILSACLQAIAPRSIAQAEACQRPADILPYYGEDTQSTVAVAGHGERSLKRTDEVQMAYHFPIMPAIWASMVTHDPSSFWKAFKETPQIPDSAAWAMFLRGHDELTLEMVDPQTRKIVYDALVKKGEPFRDGLGVSGRMSNLLSHNPRKIALINSILFSLPGVPVIYYGDEIGARNSRSFMQEAAKQRGAQANQSGVGMKSFTDTRDLGRAPIPKKGLLDAQKNPDTLRGRIYRNTKRLIQTRKDHSAMSQGTLREVQSNRKSTFSYLREYQNEKILVVNNLSGVEDHSILKLPEDIKAGELNTATVYDLLTGRHVKMKLNAKQNAVKIPLKPLQSLWIKLG